MKDSARKAMFAKKGHGLSSEWLEKQHDNEIKKSGHSENWSIGTPKVTDRSPKGMKFFHGGKAYRVHIDNSLGTIAVDEEYQDKHNQWHTGKNIIFAQGDDATKL